MTRLFIKSAFYIIFIISSLIFPAFAYEEELFGDEIFIEAEGLKLNIDNKLPNTYKKTLEQENTELRYQKGRVSLFSNSSLEDNDYMTKDYKTRTGATLNPGGRLSLTGGMEMTYQNPDASINSKKLYLTHDLRFTDDISLTASNKFDQDTKVYENELGVKYMPKFLQNSYFKVTAGTVFDDETVKSQKLKFSTDLFLF